MKKTWYLFSILPISIIFILVSPLAFISRAAHNNIINGIVLDDVHKNNNKYATFNKQDGTLTINKDVIEIKNNVYSDATWDGNPSDAIKKIVFQQGSQLEKLGSLAFAGKEINNKIQYSIVTSLIIPRSVQELANKAFYGFRSLKTLTFETNSKLKIIGDNAFFHSYDLTKIIIPKSVVSIGNNAFYYSYFDTLIFQGADDNTSKLQSIGDRAFEDTFSIKKLDLPNSLIKIGDYAFNNCINIKSLNLKKNINLTTIGNYTFGYLQKLKTLVLPANISSIGIQAFANSSIISLTFLGAVPLQSKREIKFPIDEDDPNSNAFASTSISAIQGNDWQTWAKTLKNVFQYKKYKFKSF